MFDFLEKPMKLTGNVDQRYFSETDEPGEYKATPLFKRVVARDAKSYYRNLIDKLDDFNAYHGDPKEKDIQDKWAMEEERAKYQKEFDELDKRWFEYKSNHPDEFDIAARVNTGGEDENRFISGFIPTSGVNGLDEAVRAYNAAAEYLKQWDKGGDNYDQLPTENYLVSKPDFKDKHADLRKSWYPEVGLPEPDHFIIMKHTSERNFIWQRAKKLGTDDSPIEEFTKELAEYICNRN